MRQSHFNPQGYPTWRGALLHDVTIDDNSKNGLGYPTNCLKCGQPIARGSRLHDDPSAWNVSVSDAGFYHPACFPKGGPR
jgi:hypothetical protein